MPTVELVYDRQCPSVPEARAHLLSAFVQVGLTPQWSEYQIGEADTPEHARGYGSPTILINGRDVSGAVAGAETSCRLYSTDRGGLSRAPAISEIATALASAAMIPRPKKRAGGWGTSLAMLPGIGAALLPKVACPACWPAYAGFLSSLGLGFLMDHLAASPHERIPGDCARRTRIPGTSSARLRPVRTGRHRGRDRLVR